MKNNWIDINDRLPDPGDEDTSYASFGIFVNAWMPLPEIYRREE